MRPVRRHCPIPHGQMPLQHTPRPSWRHSVRRALGLAAALAVGITVFACVRDATSTDETMETGQLIVVPNTAQLAVGGVQQLRALGGDGAIVWSTSDAAVATVQRGKVIATGLGTATIRAVSGGSRAIARINVVLPPSIVVQPVGLAFSAYTGGAVPASQTATVSNGGDNPLGEITVGTITYSAGSSGWLSVTLTPGTDGATLEIQPTTTVLVPGNHTATIPILSPNAENSPHPLTVTYQVSAAPDIALGQSAVTFSGQRNGALPNEQQVTVNNSGGATLSGLSVSAIVYSGATQGWLFASLNQTTAPTSLRLRPTTTALVEGTYTAKVAIASSLPGVAADTVTVTYNVAPEPVPARIVLSPDNLTFSAQGGGAIPAQQTVNISNGGDLTLNGLSRTITYASDNGWLDATLNGTVAPTTMTVRPNRVLAVGSHVARVIVSSPTAASPDTVLVTFNVTQPPQICVSTTFVPFQVRAATSQTLTTNVQVSNCGGGSLTGLQAQVAMQSGSGWLSAFVPSTAPANLTISVLPIPPGAVSGTVTLTAPSSNPVVVNVTYTRIATWSGDVYPIIQARSCIGCHSTGTAFNEFTVLSDVNVAYDTVTTRISADAGIKLVTTDSLTSYFYHQVRRNAGFVRAEDVMPPGSTPACATSGCFTAEEIRIVGVWIRQGAQRNP